MSELSTKRLGDGHDIPIAPAPLYAGLYAIMPLTVSRRTREIGVRVALGANRARVAREIFTRGLEQVSLGVLIGAGCSA